MGFIQKSKDNKSSKNETNNFFFFINGPPSRIGRVKNFVTSVIARFTGYPLRRCISPFGRNECASEGTPFRFFPQ